MCDKLIGTVVDGNCSYQVHPATWRDKLRRRVFPSKRVPHPEAPAEFVGVVQVDVTCILDWRDRLRTLLSGRVQVEVRSVTEHEVGGIVTASEVYVLPAAWLE